jgi:hypothetical protein
MIYTVTEVSNLINLSKASIYNKIKSKDFKAHITKRQGITYLDETALNLIQSVSKNYKEDLTDNIPDDEIATDMHYTNTLKEDITYLKCLIKENELKFDNQLSVKDLQIHELNERLKQEQDLNKNNQVLQLRQPQDLKALESHFQDLDTKLEEIKGNMIHKKEQPEHSKGFLSKIFQK